MRSPKTSLTLRRLDRGHETYAEVATILLSAARLPLAKEARGFAPPPRGGLTFVVGIGFIPRNVHNTQHVVQKATRTGTLCLGSNMAISPSLPVASTSVRPGSCTT